MSPEEYETKLTAFALNDPSLTADDHREIEMALTRDPAAKKHVDDTKQVAAVLTMGLAAELELPARIAIEGAVLPAEELPAYSANRGTIITPSLALRAGEENRDKKPTRNRRASFIIAASVLLGVGAVVYVLPTQNRVHESAMNSPVRVDTTVLMKDGEQTKNDPAPSIKGYQERFNSQSSAQHNSNRAGFGGGIGGIGGGGIGGIGGIGGGGGIGGIGGGGIGGGGTGGGIGGGGIGGGGIGGGGIGGGGIGGFNGNPTPLSPTIPVPAIAAPNQAGQIFPTQPTPSLPVAGENPGSGGRAQGGEKKAEIFIEGYRDKTRYATDKKISKDEPFHSQNSEKLKPSSDSLHSGDLQGTNRFVADLENKFIAVEGQNALSTFGVDVDTASYSIVRKFLANNQMPPAAAVRLEEMVNYFPYRDAPPEGNDPYKVTVELAECPWQPTHKLARIGLKAKPIDNDKRPASNLVFLIDVSGSMDAPNRLPWVKQSMRMLVDQLKESDRVAIVVYASACGVVLDSINATRKNEILSSIDGLQAGGSTNGGSGIQLAYDVASKHFIEGGTNRVILCTDGDWNVGTTSTEALMEMIEAKRKTGVFLSVLGFGMGNLRDEMMVKLAGKGNGNYAYIDELKEARKVLVEQMSGTLVTVAKDVKIQIEFNPARVASYRLLGYEKRALATKDFADDKKDAGEMGAGHVVTALYEIVPTEAAAVPVKQGDQLKYQANPEPAAPAAKGIAGEAFTLKLRHKMPSSDVSTLREMPVKDVTVPYAQASEDFRFAAAVASFSMILRESPYKGNASFGLVAELAKAAKTYDPSEYRAEFIQMVDKAKQLSGRP